MYIGGSLLLIAIGAVLRWAVDWQVSGFNVQMAGLIILVVGILGLVLSLIFWFTRRSTRDRRSDGLPAGEYRSDDLPPRA